MKKCKIITYLCTLLQIRLQNRPKIILIYLGTKGGLVAENMTFCRVLDEKCITKPQFYSNLKPHKTNKKLKE